jgi:hypothetical protein
MKNKGASESHTNNSLKTNMVFAKFLGPEVTFYNIQSLLKNTKNLNKINLQKPSK